MKNLTSSETEAAANYFGMREWSIIRLWALKCVLDEYREKRDPNEKFICRICERFRCGEAFSVFARKA